MKNVRRILASVLVLIVLIVMSGCAGILKTMFTPRVSEKELEAEIFAYLYKKYRVEFEADFLDKENPPQLNCHPKGGDREADRVRVMISGGFEKSAKRRFEDNYFSIIIREDVEAEVLDALSGFPLPIKVYFKGDKFFDDIFDGTKTYADYKKWRAENNASGWLDVKVCVSSDGLNESEKEVYANQVFDSIEKTGSPWDISVCFFPNEAFEKVPRGIESFNKLATQYYDEYARFAKLLNLSRHIDAIIHEGVETELRDTLSGLPMPMRVYFRGASSYPERSDGGRSFSDLKRWIGNGYAAQLSVTVCAFTDQLDDAEKEVYAQQIFDRIEEDGLPWHIEVLFFPAEALREITRVNQDELAAQYRDEYAIFSKSVNEASSTAP